MSKNPSERNQTPGHTYETGRGKQERPKFVSDDDIVGRRHRPVRSTQRDQKEPKFVSDEDIVQRRVA